MKATTLRGLATQPEALQQLVATYLGVLEIARLRQTCRALHTALGEDALWRALFVREWGPEAAETSAIAVAQQDKRGRLWAARFAGRAAQRERWRRHRYETQQTAHVAGKWLSDVAVHAETLFVTTERATVLTFALPTLSRLATWLPYSTTAGRVALWVCGGDGPGAWLVTHAARAPLRLWTARQLSVRKAPWTLCGRPSPPCCQLELALPPPETSAPPLQPLQPVAVFCDATHATVLALCASRRIFEWSLQSGQLLRQLLYPEPIPYSALVQYNQQQLVVDHVPLYLDAAAASAAPGMIDWPTQMWSGDGPPHPTWVYGPLASLIRLPPFAEPPPLDTVMYVLPDLGRPRRSQLARHQILDLRRRVAALVGTTRLRNLAFNDRFLVLLLQNDTLAAIDYGPPLPPLSRGSVRSGQPAIQKASGCKTT